MGLYHVLTFYLHQVTRPFGQLGGEGGSALKCSLVNVFRNTFVFRHVYVAYNDIVQYGSMLCSHIFSLVFIISLIFDHFAF
jgi:hypothetical protein